MGRRIFAEKNFNISGKVVSYEDFKLFIDKPVGFSIYPEYIPNILANADRVMNKDYPHLLATDYMMFKRDGNRSIFEEKFFQRRNDLLALAFAEYVDDKGKYLDKIIDLLWMILEETTWVLPAHNPDKIGVNTCLPYAYAGEVDYIDLFSATTAVTLSWVYYFCKDKFDKVTTILNERILFEINRRIIKPFLDPVACAKKMWWTGVKGNLTNNWAPWIVSNILNICALTVKDTPTREAIVRLSLPMLDSFTAAYKDDGGCEEGPGYWGAAGAALFNACEVLYDLTNGYINIYDDPLLKNMGEYVVKVIIHGNRALNFADCPARVNPSAILLYQWGVLCNSEMMKTYGQNRLNGNLPILGTDSGMPYRAFKFFSEERLPKCDFVAPTKVWLDGLVVASTRESSKTDEGLYLAIKGGHNNESHNHNDIGNVVVFADGKPIFIDAGSGRYTRRTFSGGRYDIWAMRSDYHNVPTINGIVQSPGIGAYSCDHLYEDETGMLTMNLKNAYPAEADINAYTRSAVLKNSVVTITDDISLKSNGDIYFSFICTKEPDSVTSTTFSLQGRTISFDPLLEYKCEPLDKSYPEVENIPSNWNVDTLYRVTLTSKSKFKTKKFILTVK